MTKRKPVKVAVTGAAGQIAYSLLFRIAAGEMLGRQQPLSLQLLELPTAIEALKGTVMELEDCAFPLLTDIAYSTDPATAFKDADYCLLVGSRPRGKCMERKDLLQANARIFTEQGAAIDANAARGVKVLVVGNPANTNALIAYRNAPSLSPSQFTAMTRLDHNRAIAQLAAKTGQHSSQVSGMVIWGNHSATQYPDIHHCKVAGKPATSLVDLAWVEQDFIPRVQQRGAAVIKARGLSSAASAAAAAIEHMRDWVMGTDSMVSMAVPSDGSYGIEKGLMFSYPCTCSDGEYHIVQGLEINDFSQARINATQQELKEERDAVADLLP